MAEKLTVYNSGFYEGQREGSRKSAQRIVPEIMRMMNVGSVVDVGCGVGTWLRVFQDCGVTDLYGVDGDYVDVSSLEINPNLFKAYDLQRPLQIDRQFDLAISLEVAEHLPPEMASQFADSLTRLAPVLMFSAAMPFQNGTNHLNEQWPDYWAAKFREKGYVPVDCIRPRVWSDETVEPWYAQNTVVFVKEDRLNEYPELVKERAATSDGRLSMVHPKIYFKARYKAQLDVRRAVTLDQLPLRRIFTSLPHRMARALSDRLHGRTAEALPAQVSHPSDVPLSATHTAQLATTVDAGTGSR